MMHTCSCGERYSSERGRIDCEKSHSFTPAYTQKELEARLREARSAATYKAWLDMMGEFTDKDRRHVANLLAHSWKISGIVLSRHDRESTTLGNARAVKSSPKKGTV